MKNSFEDRLLSGGELMARTYALIGENISKAIAILTALIAVLLTFADIGFLGIGTTELTTSLAVMLVSSYIIYFSLLDAGERLGKGSEEYRAATALLRSLTDRVRGDMLPSLRDFCADYREAELDYRRRALLTDGGYTTEEYEAWLRGGKASRSAARLYKRAKRLRAIALTPSDLLRTDGGAHSAELANPTRHRVPALLIKLIPTTLCSLLTASMLITAKDGLTASVVIEGIVKLSCLPIIGLRGYAEGYRFAREGLTAWCESKARLLSSFLESHESTPPLPPSELTEAHKQEMGADASQTDKGENT